MATKVPVEAEGWKFDLNQVGIWVSHHPYLTGLIVLIAYIFWISRRDGLLGVIVEDRRAKRELNAKLVAEREKLLLEYKQRARTPVLAAPRKPVAPRRRPRMP